LEVVGGDVGCDSELGHLKRKTFYRCAHPHRQRDFAVSIDRLQKAEGIISVDRRLSRLDLIQYPANSLFLNEGQRIAFDIVADRRTGKSSADNLRTI
jgi:hypothetical protein